MKGFILGETQTNFLIQSLITIKRALTACAVKCFMVDINWCKSHLVFINFSFQNTTIFQKIFNFYLVVEKALIAKHVQNFLLIFAIQGFKIIVFIQSIISKQESGIAKNPHFVSICNCF